MKENELKRPLLDAPIENPYISKNKKKQSTIVDKQAMKKKGSDVPVSPTGQDLIKMSDIMASNPVIIEEVRRTESNQALMERVKVSEGQFQT